MPLMSNERWENLFLERTTDRNLIKDLPSDGWSPFLILKPHEVAERQRYLEKLFSEVDQELAFDPKKKKEFHLDSLTTIYLERERADYTGMANLYQEIFAGIKVKISSVDEFERQLKEGYKKYLQMNKESIDEAVNYRMESLKPERDKREVAAEEARKREEKVNAHRNLPEIKSEMHHQERLRTLELWGNTTLAEEAKKTKTALVLGVAAIHRALPFIPPEKKGIFGFLKSKPSNLQAIAHLVKKLEKQIQENETMQALVSINAINQLVKDLGQKSFFGQSSKPACQEPLLKALATLKSGLPDKYQSQLPEIDTRMLGESQAKQAVPQK